MLAVLLTYVINILYVACVVNAYFNLFSIKKPGVFTLPGFGYFELVYFTIAQHDYQDFVLIDLTILLRLRVSLNFLFLIVSLFIILR